MSPESAQPYKTRGNIHINADRVRTALADDTDPDGDGTVDTDSDD